MNEIQKTLTWRTPKEIEMLLKQKYTTLLTVKKGDGKTKVYFYRHEPAIQFFTDICELFDEVKIAKKLTQVSVIITPNRV